MNPVSKSCLLNSLLIILGLTTSMVISFIYIYFINKHNCNNCCRFSIGLLKASDDAKRLLDDLLANYNNIVRPVIHSDDQIKLYLGIKLSQIADIVIFFNYYSYFRTFLFNFNWILFFLIKGREKSNNDNKRVVKTRK